MQLPYDLATTLLEDLSWANDGLKLRQKNMCMKVYDALFLTVQNWKQTKTGNNPKQ